MASKTYNIPNLLTYGRIAAVPLIVLCFFAEGRLHGSDFARWFALGLYIIASITDFLDGYLARIWNQMSNIGRMLDPIADKLLVSSILLLLAAPAGDKVLPYTTEIGIGLLWIAALITIYTGYDYFRAGLKHVVED